MIPAGIVVILFFCSLSVKAECSSMALSSNHIVVRVTTGGAKM